MAEDAQSPAPSRPAPCAASPRPCCPEKPWGLLAPPPDIALWEGGRAAGDLVEPRVARGWRHPLFCRLSLGVLQKHGLLRAVEESHFLENFL
ncbi:hypothetical protein AV530_000175 [Patagioenas fasciata monilis]|uniref:Uncharacterized protein n=1 Tax=Patagioenas fasciata monilis TaxID=372326 RepID=A0A1V4K9A2_PATFA|nr:hypothetical protein AV530_000175 [Patagioenas fasciata monilis]